MARKKVTEEKSSGEKREQSLAERTQILDKLCAYLSVNTGIIAGRPDVSESVKERLTFKFFETPIPELNEALGGGFPVGKMVLIAGPEDCGKTGTCMSFIAHQHKINPNFIAAWCESEDSLDINKAESLYGIDKDRFYAISNRRPDSPKEVFGAEAMGNAIKAMIESTHIDCVVINSLKMLVPMVESKKNLEEESIALQARYNAKLIKLLIPLCAEQGTTLIIVQHYTTKIGVMFGNPVDIAGGRAIRYNNMCTLEFGAVKPNDGDPVNSATGLKIHVRVTKNHCVIDRNPRVDFYFYVEYGKGIERHVSTLNLLMKQGIVKQAGAWYCIVDDNGEKNQEFSWQGKNAYKADMEAHPEKFEQLCGLLRGESLVNELSAEEIAEIEEQEAEDAAIMEKAG